MRLRMTLMALGLMVGSFAFVGALLVGMAGEDTYPDQPNRPVAAVPAPDVPSAVANRGPQGDQLHQDYDMTQYMSGPGARGPMFTGQTTDPQLRHSRDPAFVQRLEQHQQDMDRMLARG